MSVNRLQFLTRIRGNYSTLTKESSFYFVGIGRPGKRPTWAYRRLGVYRRETVRDSLARLGEA
jgi:hypothetical protein